MDLSVLYINASADVRMHFSVNTACIYCVICFASNYYYSENLSEIKLNLIRQYIEKAASGGRLCSHLQMLLFSIFNTEI